SNAATATGSSRYTPSHRHSKIPRSTATSAYTTHNNPGSTTLTPIGSRAVRRANPSAQNAAQTIGASATHPAKPINALLTPPCSQLEAGSSKLIAQPEPLDTAC